MKCRRTEFRIWNVGGRNFGCENVGGRNSECENVSGRNSRCENVPHHQAIRSNSIQIPQDDMWRAPLSGLSQGEAHDTREHHTRTIAYPIRICCPDHWLLSPSDGVSGRPVRTFLCSLHSGFAYGKGLQSFASSCFWAFHCFAMDSKELSSISDCFGDQKAIKTPKLNTIWLELIAKVLNILIGLKGDNYYSKVFIRVNYKLWNSTFWVVIIDFLNILMLSNIFITSSIFTFT